MAASEAYNVDCMDFMRSLPDKKRFVTKHGMSRTRLYRIYIGIKVRCYSPSCVTYKKYGAKGIRVCDEWMGENGFINFAKWSKENGYSDALTIDRIDSSGNYSPENCRWATHEEQNTHLAMLKSNTSGLIGVSWSKKERKWLAVISLNNHSRRIGSFETKEEAAEARNRFIETNGLPHQKAIIQADEDDSKTSRIGKDGRQKRESMRMKRMETEGTDDG